MWCLHVYLRAMCQRAVSACRGRGFLWLARPPLPCGEAWLCRPLSTSPPSPVTVPAIDVDSGTRVYRAPSSAAASTSSGWHAKSPLRRDLSTLRGVSATESHRHAHSDDEEHDDDGGEHGGGDRVSIYRRWLTIHRKGEA